MSSGHESQQVHWIDQLALTSRADNPGARLMFYIIALEPQEKLRQKEDTRKVSWVLWKIMWQFYLTKLLNVREMRCPL